MLELDCHLTKDKQVVVCHDHKLLRATGLDKKISELDYKDLPPLLPTIPVDFDPGIVALFQGQGQGPAMRCRVEGSSEKGKKSLKFNLGSVLSSGSG